MRSCGILLHITSLPSKYGIGTLGKEAFRFVDFLKESGQGMWQILPVGPTCSGDSPYQSFSSFAGNPLLIDLEKLIDLGLLTDEKVAAVDFGQDVERVDYEKQFLNKYPILYEAFQTFKKQGNWTEYNAFCDRQKEWLKDYSLFMALKYHFNQKPWNQWEDDIKKRDLAAVERYEKELKNDIQYWSFIQFLFDCQWRELKEYANSQNIKIIGDIPIYLSYDSVDVWTHPELFELDQELNPIRVAGYPPDDTFSKTGQLWGNPLYRWDVMKQNKYAWWINRIRFSLEVYDILRIDHFRGFDSYYAIPFKDKTAEHGEWVLGPGKDLFKEIKCALGEIPIIAEDLGLKTDSVKQMLAYSGYPGMNVMEYAFSGENESEDMPHNFVRHSVTYLGTHDNDTCLGYLTNQTEDSLHFIQKYLGTSNIISSLWGMIRFAYASVSELVVIQMQDFLELGSESRMNYPSTLSGNWTWRMKNEDINRELAMRIRELSCVYFRMPKKGCVSHQADN